MSKKRKFVVNMEAETVAGRVSVHLESQYGVDHLWFHLSHLPALVLGLIKLAARHGLDLTRPADVLVASADSVDEREELEQAFLKALDQLRAVGNEKT